MIGVVGAKDYLTESVMTQDEVRQLREEFRHHEYAMCERGCGLTEQQRIGVAVFLCWLETHKATDREICRHDIERAEVAAREGVELGDGV